MAKKTIQHNLIGTLKFLFFMWGVLFLSTLHLSALQPEEPKTKDTIGVYRKADDTFYLKNSNSSDSPDLIVPCDPGFRDPGMVPVVGDWNNDGTDTVGVYSPGTHTFFLKNSNGKGPVDVSFAYGGEGDIPVAGDWDGNGSDTIGVYRPSAHMFLLRNSNSAGAVDVAVAYGGAGDIPVVGDWDGDDVTTIGVYRPSTYTFYLRNSNTQGPADIAFSFGEAGEIPIAGDWDNDGLDTIGMYNPLTGIFSLKNFCGEGPADMKVTYGEMGDAPVVGNWDGIPPCVDYDGDGYCGKFKPEPPGAACVMHLDEAASSTRFQDESGNNNTGTCSYEACPTAGILDSVSGTALRFAGTANYVYITPLFLPRDWTISLWFKTTSYPIDSARIFELAQSSDAGLQLSLTPDGTIGIENSGGPAECVRTATPLNDGMWHHAVVVRYANKYIVYVDRVYVGETVCGLPAFPVYTRLFLGVKSDLSRNTFFNGAIDEVRVYDRALSGREILLDCDDYSAEIHPGAREICGDGVDNDCDGAVDNDDSDCAGARVSPQTVGPSPVEEDTQGEGGEN